MEYSGTMLQSESFLVPIIDTRMEGIRWIFLDLRFGS